MNESAKRLILLGLQSGDWSGASDVTLEEARQYIGEVREVSHLDDKSMAIKCPCCDVRTKVNKFSLTSRHWWFLLLYIKMSTNDIKAGGDGIVKYRDVQNKVTDQTKFHVSSYGNMGKWPWALIEPDVDENGKSKRSGGWKPTERGKKWARGQIIIPETIFVYNASVVGYSDVLVGCKQIKDVNFQEGMDAYRTW